MSANPEIEAAIKANTIIKAIDFIKRISIDPAIPTITEWAEKNRYLPEGSTERPGLWTSRFVTYAQEIQEQFHPDSPARIISVLKSTQALITTTIENAIGHSIRYGLHNILYVISDIEVAKMRSSGAIDLLIDYCGLKEFVKPITIRDGQRKSGDTILYKELGGGRRFLMTSYKALAKLKSFSYDLIIMDELAEAPHQLKGQGDPETIIEKRGQTIKNLKVGKISTPGKSESCKMYRAFKSGDQREYMIPCPRCGGMQFLVFMKDNMTHGLYGDYIFDKRGKASLAEDSVRYKCLLCEKDFFEYEKTKFMLNKENGGIAFWQPQAAAQDPRDFSYHVNAIMSPMTDWSNIVTDYLKTGFGKKIQEYKNFVITNEGFPPISSRSYKPWRELKQRAEKYEIGTAPEGALILFGGIDVQKNRLELQVVGFGRGLESWIVDYQIFYGQTANLDSECWKELLKYANKKYMINNKEVFINQFAIDMGYNPNKDESLSDENLKSETSAVISFCKKNAGIFTPVRGINSSRMVVNTKQAVEKSAGVVYYMIDSESFKDEIMENIEKEDGYLSIHFCDSLNDEYFRQFLSEVFTEIEDGKMGYKKIYERNETLDTFVYARSLCDITGINRWDESDWAEYSSNLFS